MPPVPATQTGIHGPSRPRARGQPARDGSRGAPEARRASRRSGQRDGPRPPEEVFAPPAEAAREDALGQLRLVAAPHCARASNPSARCKTRTAASATTSSSSTSGTPVPVASVSSRLRIGAISSAEWSATASSPGIDSGAVSHDWESPEPASEKIESIRSSGSVKSRLTGGRTLWTSGSSARPDRAREARGGPQPNPPKPPESPKRATEQSGHPRDALRSGSNSS